MPATLLRIPLLLVFLEFVTAAAFCVAVMNWFGAASSATGWRAENWGDDGWPLSALVTVMIAFVMSGMGLLTQFWLWRAWSSSLPLLANTAAILLSAGVAFLGYHSWWLLVIACGATVASFATQLRSPEPERT